MVKIHPFEAAGFGHAPFRYVGYSQSKFQAAPGQPFRAGSSCDYCSTAIMDVFTIRSADGRTFKVGCDCLRKTYEEFDGTVPREFRLAIAAADREKREAKRLVEWERVCRRVEKAKELFAASPETFADKPHPHPYHASQGRTLRDYYGWLLQHGGASGKADACRAIEKAAVLVTV